MQRLLFVLLSLFLALSLKAELGDAMGRVSRTDGLSGESVTAVATDALGCAWIATSNGVSMFNGKRVVAYPLDGGDGRNFRVTDICVTADGTVYAATINGLFALKPGDEAFARVLPAIEQPENLTVLGDSLLIGSTLGMHIYVGGRMKTVEVGASQTGIDKLVRCIKRAAHGDLWLNNRYELFLYHVKSGRLESVLPPGILSADIALGQFEVIGNKIFLGTKNNGLLLYDQNTRQLKRVAGIGNIVTSIMLSSDGLLCISTDGSGAYAIDPQTETIIYNYGTQEDEIRRIATDAVYCYYRDANGVDWLGLARHGLAYTYHSSRLFSTYSLGDFTTRGINVRSFCINGTERILGTMRGFYYVNETTGAVQYFPPEMLNGAHIVTCIAPYQGLYYLGTYDGGLKIFNPQTLSMQPQSLSPLLDAASVTTMQEDADHQLWIGSGEGLFILDSLGRARRFTDQNSHLSRGSVRAVLFDDHQNAWLPGMTGISRYISKLQTFENTGFPKNFFHEKRGIMGARKGHDKQLFFFGIPVVYYTTADMSHFGALQLPPRLMEERCTDFLDDFQGHYWFGSEKGLFRINYDLTGAIHFGQGEGVGSSFINSMAMDADSTLWIATGDGLVSLPADALEAWSKDDRYQVRLYNIRRGGRLLSHGEESMVNGSRELRVGWNIVSGELSVMPVLGDFARPDGRLYEYSLDGNRQWTVVADGQEIIVAHLLLGQHELAVRLAGAPGTTTVYTITVYPTWVAIAEAVLLVALIIGMVLFWRYRKNTKTLLHERDEIEEALIEIEQQQQREAMPKYQRVKIDEKESADIVARMKAYIETERVYTNPDLKMSDLAEVLHVSPSKLSQIFTQYIGENYYEFINGYRLAEFKRLVADGAHRRFTLTALSEQCGFKRANFFSTFRRVEGMTPAEYMKKNNA